ncbi:phosphatase PAP2 family protein [Streptomyces sp. HNM0645]|uniref:phosphatase PAP2 family protein n=1 Tax=Streptomyces sp. HNM0645 TaxID=2782343 RepID=UPI0024B83DBB|nr:phosphatase PAP2 family protein [Streptomyces sp. HNM0645]MDI9888327.1 phosphatase PAP2 family protein [Streptomyces sp. HNM0645]
MRETPRSQGTAGDSMARPPQPRLGRALAHTTGASCSGSPLRSDGRPPQTPRGARQTDPHGRPGTTPPVPGRPAPFLGFRGLDPLGPLSGPAVVAALCAALFALITWQVVGHGPLRALDEHVDRALVGEGPAGLAEVLADLGNVQVALPVLAAAVGLALYRRRRVPAAAVVVAMALVPALVAPLKELTDRPGPLTPETGYFPSGHAATAMVAYTGAALLVGRRAMPVAVLLTVATGVGLVLRGYHWPLDVLGSWSLCGVLLAGAVLVSSGDRRRSRAGTPSRRTGPG